MQRLQLYINNATSFDQVEMFDDESVVLTQSIKDIKDIGKVYADFTQTFTVPASQRNNKIFKHCYNYNITDGFDVRFLVEARIEINYAPFKNGFIQLEGVSLESGSPTNYKITFYGDVLKLKDVLGSNKISDIPSADLDLSMDITDFSLALTKEHDDVSQPEDGYIVPLITTDQELYYELIDSQDSGNLYYSIVRQGLKIYGLKYAIRLSKLISYIENDYGLTFASDSFFKDDTKDLPQLFMWLNAQTDVVDLKSGGDYNVDFTTLVGSGGGASGSINGNGDIVMNFTDTVQLNASPSSNHYDLVIKLNGDIYETLIDQQGAISNHPIDVTSGDILSITVNTYESGITVDDPNNINAAFWVTRFFLDGSTLKNDTFKTADTLSFNKFFVFNVAKNMPDITIIDLFSGLFKMFNLVSYVKPNGEIQVQPLPDYYAGGDTIDITKYIDREKTQINTSTLYDNILFEYEDTKSILADQHKESLSPQKFSWGGVRYDNNISNIVRGKKYEVKPPFAHMKFERILNRQDLTDPLSIQYGININIEGDTHKGKPLLFFYENVTLDREIAYVYNGILSSFSSGYTMNIPLNTPTTSSTSSIHFNPEFNEYTEYDADPDVDTPATTDTLFARFYDDTISNIFDFRSRLVKITVFLPSSIIQKISLDDTIIIRDQSFRINKMKTNLMNGKTEIELLTV